MKITIEFENEAEAMFALHLAQRDGGATEMADYFLGLHWANEELHPDTRYCSSLECGDKVIPACTVEPCKNVPNPFFQCKVSTRPIDVCPDCGAKTVTVEEHLNTVDCCTTWIAHMRAHLAAEKAFPARKDGEPYGKEPAPMIRVIAEPAGEGGRSKPRAARKAKPKSVPGVRVFV
jgi:hypothetical protein